jgi:hypothetical protein
MALLPTFRYFQFPDPAGTYQRSGDTRSFIAELAANYGRYHEALADAFEKAGSKMPDPRSYAGDPQGFADAAARVQEFLWAESMLRELAKASGSSTVDPGAPIVDELHRLVSADPSTETRQSRQGNPAVADWQPPR